MATAQCIAQGLSRVAPAICVFSSCSLDFPTAKESNAAASGHDLHLELRGADL